jgi:hypothetical protein
MNLTCKQCGYVAEIPSNMTPGTYAQWHNWALPVKIGPSGALAFCSQCHAQVPKRLPNRVGNHLDPQAQP